MQARKALHRNLLRGQGGFESGYDHHAPVGERFPSERSHFSRPPRRILLGASWQAALRDEAPQLGIWALAL
ncbi:hypothetical protein ACIRRA_42475, partial [Nocardia sp. NPDC101769]|uniref:hypothetical protein n=1 Tax=Nocardia sp. NPDC101769 TaxID=3364333 RepID=UPI00381F7193